MELYSAVRARTTVSLSCQPHAAAMARWLLEEVLPTLPDSTITPGKRFQLGWTVLTFVQEGGTLFLSEPDFDNDPNVLRPDITRSLMTIAEQNAVVKRVGVAPLDTRFDDQVLALKGFERHQSILMRRDKPQPGDSGWSIQPLGVDAPTDPSLWQSFVSCALLRLKPQLLRALSLPSGYMVVFDGDEIVGVSDPRDSEVWV